MPSLVYQVVVACASGLLLGAGPAARAQAPGRAAPPAGPASYRYVPTAALRQQTVRAVARQLQASDPTQAQAVRRHFGPGQADYDQLYTALLRASGLTDNDAASALALYLEAGYRIVNDVVDDGVVTPAMERGLRRQAAGLLAHQPGLRTPGAVARLGEQLKLQSVLLTLDWQAARASRQLPAFRATVARQLQRAYGFDMRVLRITTQGLAEQ